MTYQEEKAEFIKYIENADKIMLTTHKNPDGDAIGSVLALKYWLSKYYPAKSLRILITGAENSVWSWWEGAETVEFKEDIMDHLSEFDLAILCDGHNRAQFTNKEDFDLNVLKTVCIDHHQLQDDISFDLFIHHPEAPANCQILAELLFEDADINEESAVHMIRGILFDTGTFIYLGQGRDTTFSTIARLLNLGKVSQIDVVMLPSSVISEKDLAVIKVLMENTQNVKIPNLPGLTYSYLSLEDTPDMSREEIKIATLRYMDLVVRRVKDHPWGFVVKENEKDEFSISFRSLPNTPNVAKLANMYFGGGGHFRAAGGRIQRSPEIQTAEQACQKILEILKTTEIEIN